jgi:hypothetical protein
VRPALRGCAGEVNQWITATLIGTTTSIVNAGFFQAGGPFSARVTSIQLKINNFRSVQSFALQMNICPFLTVQNAT